MNFFDAQDKARRSTRWLVIVYIIATILIVAGVTLVVGIALHMMFRGDRPPEPAILGFTAAATTLFILGATLYKTTRLSSGGGRVAQDMGGTRVPPDVQDPFRRRLRNVVEEMAIASGVPVPEIYVLEEESGINAFAAGYTPADAAVAVTRGTLELLERDELQGVIAHEFSHILNGDMRLNIRLMGVLFGIMVLGLIGHRAGAPDTRLDRRIFCQAHQSRGVQAKGVPRRCLGRAVHTADRRHSQRTQEDRRIFQTLLYKECRPGRNQPYAVCRRHCPPPRVIRHPSATHRADPGARSGFSRDRLPEGRSAATQNCAKTGTGGGIR
jgi:hypothetical protein